MTKITDKEGRGIAFEVTDIEVQSIAGVDFSPSEDASLTADAIGKYMQGGFLVAPDADDDLYVITWEAYNNNGQSVSGLTAQEAYTTVKQFFPCRVVKVFANNTSGKTTTATAVQIGFVV